MKRHWQRRPLCIRGAFANFQTPVSVGEVLELATSGQAQARLVRHKAGRWSVSHGPHDKLPSLRTPDWTVLVNGVDRHLDEVHALLQSFRFLPDARIDDLMISVASHGGGVGPHLDSYDVFLLQAEGRRRWRIAPPGPWAAVHGAPLKLIENFKAAEEWILEPGDMLYLPPGWAHEGTALGSCMTFSIGARAPSRHEFLAALLADQADDPGGPDPRFRDAGRIPSPHAGQLPPDMVQTMQRWASGWRPSQQTVREFIGRWLTEPAADVWFEGPDRELSRRSFTSLAKRQGVRLDRATRMAWRAREAYINGESVPPDASSQALIRSLADDRFLPGESLRPLDPTAALWSLLAQWHALGWLHLLPQAPRSP